MSKLCNGVPDCTDGGDEGPHCRGAHSHTHTQYQDISLDLHIAASQLRGEEEERERELDPVCDCGTTFAFPEGNTNIIN